MGEKADFLVVGAGIVGLATAYHIARSCGGCRVLVVEKNHGPGHGDTGRSAAGFRAAFSSWVNAVLALSSVEYYLEAQRRGADLGMRLVGYLFAVPADAVERFEEINAMLRSLGVDVEEYSAEELEEGLGLRARPLDEEAQLMGLPEVAAGFLYQPAGIMRPERLVEHYYRLCKEHNVEFIFGRSVERLLVEPVPALDVRGEPLPWQAARIAGAGVEGLGEIRAGTTVVAAGALTYSLLEPIGLDPHFRPRKQRVYALRARTPEMQRLLHVEGFNEEGTAPFILLPRGIYLRPVPEEESFWTGGSTRLGHPVAWEPEPVPEPWIYEYGVAPVLRAYLPAFAAAASYDAAWAGFYDTSLDSKPVVHRFAEGLVVAGGTSGSGIMKADAVGRATAALALGEEEAVLHGGRRLPLEQLGLDGRLVEQEKLVI